MLYHINLSENEFHVNTGKRTVGPDYVIRMGGSIANMVISGVALHVVFNQSYILN